MGTDSSRLAAAPTGPRRPGGLRHWGLPASRPPYTEIVGLGRLLIFAGVALVALGVLVSFASRLPFKLGRLPGDIYIHGRNSTFYFPVVTCILISVVLTLVMWLLRR